MPVSSGGAKIGRAPCGHLGPHVTPSYVTCGEGCDSASGEDGESDGVPLSDADPNETRVFCRECGSDDVEKWPPEWRDSDGRTFWICRDCGRSFHA